MYKRQSLYIVYRVSAYKTFGESLKNYNAWQIAGSNKANTKTYQNCIHPPTVSGNKRNQIFDTVLPPQLRPMITVVKTLSYHVIFHMTIEFDDSLNWAKTCNVERCSGKNSWNSCLDVYKRQILLFLCIYTPS